MGKIVVVFPDGNISIKETDSPPPLTELQSYVGGWVEIFAWPTLNVLYENEQAQYYGNEDGLILGLTVNHRASEIAQVEMWNSGRPLCGTIVILTGNARCE